MNQIELALSVAACAHKGQVDRGGMPYILHPMTVAVGQKSEETIIAALLHDVVEDSGMTLEDLRLMGFSEAVLEALCLLTHDKGVPYMDYIEKIKVNEIARAVKLADLKHNSDLSRLKEVGPKDLERAEKYKKAMAYLAE